LVSYSSTITMMHGPIYIRYFTKFSCSQRKPLIWLWNRNHKSLEFRFNCNQLIHTYFSTCWWDGLFYYGYTAGRQAAVFSTCYIHYDAPENEGGGGGSSQQVELCTSCAAWRGGIYWLLLKKLCPTRGVITCALHVVLFRLSLRDSPKLTPKPIYAEKWIFRV